jgi:hypothetical protein
VSAARPASVSSPAAVRVGGDVGGRATATLMAVFGATLLLGWATRRR